MSFTLGGDTFDLSNEFAPGQADVQFDQSGDLLGITYSGMDNGDILSINGLGYQDVGANAATFAGTVGITAVPEPASVAMLGAGLLTLSALRRRRKGYVPIQSDVAHRQLRHAECFCGSGQGSL